jgi:hypothetical protein
MTINSDQIIYSEHDEDECFEYKDGRGRVPDGIAVAYESNLSGIVLFNDIKYSEYSHDYWNNYELEHDSERIVLP